MHRSHLFQNRLLLALLGLMLLISGFHTAAGAASVRSLLRQLKSKDEDTRLEALWELVHMDRPEAVKAVLPFLKEEQDDWRVYEVVCAYLGRIKDPSSVQPLIEALSNEDTLIFAAMALGEIGDPKAVAPLIPVLEDEAWEHRKEAVTALGKIGGPEALKAVTLALKDEDDTVRHEAALALASFREPEAVGPLIELVMSQPRKEIPYTVIEAMGESGQSATAKAVIRVLGTRDGLMNWCALTALHALEHPAKGKPDTKAIEKAMQLLQEAPDKAHASFLRLLDKGNPATKRQAIKPLLMVPNPSTFKELTKRIKSKDPHIRMLAAGAVVSAGIPGVDRTATLSAISTSKDPALRRFAVLRETFGEEEGSLDACISALDDPDYVVRIIALRALSHLEGPAAEKAVSQHKPSEPKWIQDYVETLPSAEPNRW